MTEDFNIPINYQVPEVPQTIGAPPTEVAEPGFGLKEAATVYTALTGGTSSVIAKGIDSLVTNFLPRALGGDYGRPYLSQEQVNQLWEDNEIPDAPIDASKYNDVAVYELLDDARRRQAARDIDAATEFGAGSLVRGTTTLALFAADPANVLASLFPAGTAFKAVGLTKAAGMVSAGLASKSLAGRVGARLATGAIEGAVGNAVIEGVTAPLRSVEGEDYHAADSLVNVGLGAVMGGGIGIIHGAIKTPVHELVEGLSPQTREDALTMSVAQVEAGYDPTVASVIKSDPSINLSSAEDLKSDILPKQENNILTKDVPIIPKEETIIPFDDKVDYKSEISKLQKKQQEITDLSERGLYSQKPETEIINLEDKSLATPSEPQKLGSDKWFDDAILAAEPGADSVALAQAVETEFGKDGAALLSQGKIKIVDSVDELPGTHPKNTQGVTFQNGQVYLVAKNIAPESVRGIVAHEIGVHTNMEAYLGAKGMNDIFNQVNSLLAKDERLASIIERSVPTDTPKENIKEEQLAYLVENAAHLPIVKNLISKIKTWLFKTFPGLRNSLQLNDSDLLNIALSSVRNYSTKANVLRNTQFYSEAVNTIARIETELSEANTAAKEVDKLKNKMLQDAEGIIDIADAKIFNEYIKSKIGNIDEHTSASLFNDINAAYSRALDQALPNPAEYAIDQAMDKLQYGLEKHKTALIHDRAIKQKLFNHLKKTWTGREKQGIVSLLIGTSHTGKGSRQYTMGDNIRNNERIWKGNLDAGLLKMGLDKLFYKGAMNDDITRAMWLLEDGQSVKHLPDEAVAMAKHIMSIYDGQVNALNNNGLITNKIPHYISNQQSIHNQTKIRAAGFENWNNDAQQLFDFDKMSEAIGLTPTELKTGDTLARIFKGFADGEHIGNNGNVSGQPMRGTPFSKLSQKQRKIFFKDAESLIQYRNKYGDLDFQASVISTVAATGKKLGILQTLGVDYENNLRELVDEFIKSAPTPEQRIQLTNYSKTNMLNMLKSVDGRANRPFSESWARFGSNLRAWTSMTKLGAVTLASINDLATTGSFLDRLGMGHGILFNIAQQGGKIFTKFSPERKEMLGSLGIYNDGRLSDAFRDGQADDINQTLSKLVSTSMKIFGIDAWTNGGRMSAADSFMNYTSRFTDKTHDKLSPGMQKYLNNFGIGEDEWNLLRKTNQKQIDGNNYLVPQEIDNIKQQIGSYLREKGTADNILAPAVDRYANELKAKLINYYHDGLSHMIIEPDAGTKYYSTWGGLEPGSMGGEMARYTSQFKSFSIGFVRKVLFDQMFEDSDTALGNFKTLKGTTKTTMNMGKLIAASTLLGYVSGVLTDVSNGKNPRPLLDEDGNIDKKTLTASLLRGGGAGIYGDFLFGSTNRFGGGILATLAGPVIGGSGMDLYNSYQDMKSIPGADSPEKKAKQTAAGLLRLAQSNTPFINAFYLKGATNYLFFQGLQEYLNPGYLRRLERSAKKNNDQTYMLPPSEYAVKY